MKKVNLTEMKNGSKEDYLFLDKLEKEYVGETADRILNFLSRMTTTLEGYKITRLEHSLQSATRAFRNNESEEMVVACLLHDIGDELAPLNHSEYAASVLKPYVSEKTHWIIEKNTVNFKCIIMHIILELTDLKEKNIKITSIIKIQ